MPINITEEREHIRNFLKSQHLAVLATADANGTPHATTIYFTLDDNMNFYFLTKRETAKHDHLQSNTKAALAIFEPKSQTTVQVKGDAIEETNSTKVHEVFAGVLKAAAKTSESGIPPISKLVAGEYVVYRLTPKSIRMALFIRPDPGSYEKIFEVY